MAQDLLGNILIQKNIITEQQLNLALKKQHENGKKLGQVLVDMEMITQDVLLKVLADKLGIPLIALDNSEKLGVPFIDLDNYDVNPDLVRLLPELQARRFRAIVLKDTGSSLLIGLTDPLDIYAFDEIGQILHRSLSLAIVAETPLLNIIDRVYRHSQEITGYAKLLSGEIAEETESLGQTNELGGADAPVVKLLNSIYSDAIQAHASDIHIEPDIKGLRVRMRIDGVLHENLLEDSKIAPALVQRLKLKARLNIAEKRIPQDGSFNLELNNKYFDVRLATIPVVYGEAVVMRLLERAPVIADFDDLGMPAVIAERINKIIQNPHGMLLVTGPTGSGKTTTLYSVLKKLNTESRKIITVEDPVEYRMERINQVQVNYKIDLTFEKVLRSILRHDPDVIMVGEIRDRETARIAMRAAITGHLVLATLHTNDALGSAMRLIDMGCEGYMVASATKAVLAQRLIRKICSYCTVDHDLEPNELAWVATFMNTENITKGTFKTGKGCQHCNKTGYQGRIGIYELLEPDPEMLHALRMNDPAAFVKATLKNPYYKPLARSAFEVAQQGISSVAEVIRVAGDLQDEYQTLVQK